MKATGDSESVKMPSSLLAELQAIANEERRNHDELVREAIENYLEPSLAATVSYGDQQAKSLGLTDADVPRLIEEYCQEHQSR